MLSLVAGCRNPYLDLLFIGLRGGIFTSLFLIAVEVKMPTPYDIPK
jgi:hypothetical protein